MQPAPVEHHRFQSADPDEVSAFISQIYADNRFAAHRASAREISIAGQAWNGISICDVDYDIPFRFDSELARPNYLILSCTRGGARYSRERLATDCAPGDVIPISSTGNSTCIAHDEGLAHLSVHVDAGQLNRFAAQWLGEPLDAPILFDLKPLRADVAVQWNLAAGCLRQMLLMAPVPEAAAQGIVEHMMKMLLEGQPHEHRLRFTNPHPADETLARSAIDLIRADPLRWKSITTLAHALGCATGMLEHAIRRHAGRTSAELLVEARLDRLHRALLSTGGAQGFVETLREHGFAISNRFLLAYERRFGEAPSSTWRRNPNRPLDATRVDAGTRDLCEASIDRYIDANLSRSISVGDLARLVGLSEYDTIEAFKAAFSRTPKQYLIERRLAHARAMLRDGSATILAIAMACGFGTQSHLTATMRMHFGETPGQIRKRGTGA
ncbi:AraC family transcriptional regulator [Burkholderia gladioli]|uniref:AraC family transcriptional regulator n=1 Tax=Burkholderia gladioli TaxID=28095 RepID=UPI00163F6A27|nr:helix-turn-helix domain-containing protein [Burkholderia gladioli]